MLQQGLMGHDKIFRINIFANSFTLLDRLAYKDNSETSAVYKTLVGGFIQLYKSN